MLDRTHFLFFKVDITATNHNDTKGPVMVAKNYWSPSNHS